MASLPLRLAVDATPLLGPRTGVGMFTAELLTHLAADPALTITAWAASWRGRDTLGDELPEGVRAVTRPMAARPLRQAWARADQPPIEWWTGAVDVVHGTNYVVPPSRGAASLVSVHDLTVVRYPQLCTADTLQYPTLLRRAFARGAHVHTDSAAIAAEVCEVFDLPADRVHPVHLGIPPLPETSPGAGAALAGSERYLLALGTVEPRKDLPALVAAFGDLARSEPEITLVIAGPDGWGTEALTAALGRSPVRDRIRRLDGYLDDESRSALVRDAAVLAYPSVYEGFGLPPLEAMQLGVPVVATRVGSLPEVLGDAAIWCEPGDHEGLVDALARAFSDDRLRLESISRGRDQAARYSWDRCAAEMTALYRALATSL